MLFFWKLDSFICKNLQNLCDIQTHAKYFSSHIQIWLILKYLQYYEMSYGLNVEMHKQVKYEKNYYHHPLFCQLCFYQML